MNAHICPGCSKAVVQLKASDGRHYDYEIDTDPPEPHVCQLNLQEGLRRKNEALAFLERTNKKLTETLRNIAAKISTQNGEVCADDVRTYLMSGQMQVPESRMGTIFRGRYWEWTGRRKNSRWPPNHAREIKVWKWVGPPPP